MLISIITHYTLGWITTCRKNIRFKSFQSNLFFVSGVGFPLYPEIFYFITMILQHSRIIVGDAGFKPGTSAPEVWATTSPQDNLTIAQKIAKTNPSWFFNSLLTYSRLTRRRWTKNDRFITSYVTYVSLRLNKVSPWGIIQYSVFSAPLLTPLQTLANEFIFT